MAGSYFGHAVQRVEDPELLRGVAQYVDDLQIDALKAVFVRSPLAHAAVKSIDFEHALTMPGVVAIYDAARLGIGAFVPSVLNDKVRRYALAKDKVRFVGEPVVLVLAETTAQALDAAEWVDVTYEAYESVTNLDEALLDGAPILFEGTDTNLVAGVRAPEDDEIFEGADHIVRARVANTRMAVAPIECNAIAAIPSQEEDQPALTVYVSSQMPFRLRDVANQILDIDVERMRFVVPHVGGGFGGKTTLMAEFIAVLAAAHFLQRPVKWVETRSENLISMNGRGQVHFAEMGFKKTGEIVGLRARILGDAGAYGGFGATIVMGPTTNMIQGVYKIPKISCSTAGVSTNSAPINAFRGAGRPEASLTLERMMDIAADDLGLDPVDIRRKNLIEEDKFPYVTLTGMRYDSGNYQKVLDEVIRISDYDALRAEQKLRRDRGDRLQLGIGLSTYVEITAGGPGGEFGGIEVHEDGSATVRAGTCATGQGHATTYAMLVSDTLGIPFESITFIQADTAKVERGSGTAGSRSMQLGGVAINNAALKALDLAKELAAKKLEASTDDIVQYDDGFGVAGVPSSALSWGALAQYAIAQGDALATIDDFKPVGPTFPFGAHISVVEVDIETGKVVPLRHIAVDDAGRIINSLLALGQLHGGMFQGISQALYESSEFDADGNPQNTTFATYCIPSAADLCSYESHMTETPTPNNPLGVKGIGESATIGATPAVQNAVVDAVSHLGVRHIDLPCTPERVWTAVQKASTGEFDDPWREPPAIFATFPIRGQKIAAEVPEEVE